MNNHPDTHETERDPLSSQGIVAVFDVDRTLVPATTTERIFIRYLLRRYLWRKPFDALRGAALTALLVLRGLGKVSPYEAIRRERVYLRGLRYDRMVVLARRCFETDIKPRISRAGIEAVREHTRQGHMVVLLSGSLDFLLEPLKEYLDADHLIAANMEVVNGRLTGRILGQYPYGNLKAALIQHFAEEHGLDFSRSFAYADHHSDHDILRLFANPVVVNPRKRMQEIARREGWTVKDFR